MFNFRVNGTVQGVIFDKSHILTKKGDQVISGKKSLIGDAILENLTVNGLVNTFNLSKFFYLI